MRRSLAAAVAILVAAAGAIWTPARSDESAWTEASVRARFPDPDAAAGADDFVDKNSQCKECHDEKAKNLAKSWHSALGASKGFGELSALFREKPPGLPARTGHGCQECHGPGAKHADDEDTPIRNPNEVPDVAAPPKAKPPKEGEAPRARRPVSVAEIDGVCLRCHLDVLTKPLLQHPVWLSRTRDPSGTRSCVSCHAIHVDKSTPAFQETAPFATLADSVAKASYADPATCVACHTEFHPEMARSGHADLLRDGPGHGCGACHGAGSLHVASGGDAAKIVMPEKQRPADADAACNACHLKGAAVARWTCAEHSRNAVACIVCHDPNAAKGHTLRDTEFNLCGKCHVDVQAQFRLPNRHRVAEGRVSCSDCHDPHGNTDKIRDKDVRWRGCAQCHQEKFGPFMFDHGIKRTEGCVACHDPHGSTNRRMLTYPRVQPLCLQCHPETPHDIKSPKYRNCIECHTEVHGSDLDRKFLK